MSSPAARASSEKKVIVHVAETEISEGSGMGRVAWHWRQAFLDRGYEFIHIGPSALPARYSKSLFPLLALRHLGKLGVRNPLLLLHEPVGGVFIARGYQGVVFSHGLERRCAAALLDESPTPRNPLRRLLTAPLWKMRGWSCDSGLRRAAGVLAINEEDAAFLRTTYLVPDERIFVFRNGVNAVATVPPITEMQRRTVLFLGSWLRRKGTGTICEAAKILLRREVQLNWVFAGIGVDPRVMLLEWPAELHATTEVIPKFSPNEETAIIQRCGIFVLPSQFEGQPLSLLQAMENERCCLASATCGQLDLIQHGDNGLLHPPGDAAELARQIEECVNTPVRTAALGLRARQSVQGRSWSAVSAEVADFVEARAATLGRPA